MSREKILIILLIACLVVAFLVIRSKALLLKKVLLLIVVIACFFGMGTFVNLNCLNPDIKEAVEEIKNNCPGTDIVVKGSKVYIKYGGKLYDIDKIKVIGYFTRDVKISYEGEEIVLDSPGIKNALRIIERIKSR